MILISMGIGSLILAAIEHRRSTLALKVMYGDVEPRSMAGLVAGAIGALGLLCDRRRLPSPVTLAGQTPIGATFRF